MSVPNKNFFISFEGIKYKNTSYGSVLVESFDAHHRVLNLFKEVMELLDKESCEFNSHDTVRFGQVSTSNTVETPKIGFATHEGNFTIYAYKGIMGGRADCPGRMKSKCCIEQSPDKQERFIFTDLSIDEISIFFDLVYEGELYACTSNKLTKQFINDKISERLSYYN